MFLAMWDLEMYETFHTAQLRVMDAAERIIRAAGSQFLPCAACSSACDGL